MNKRINRILSMISEAAGRLGRHRSNPLESEPRRVRTLPPMPAPNNQYNVYFQMSSTAQRIAQHSVVLFPLEGVVTIVRCRAS